MNYLMVEMKHHESENQSIYLKELMMDYLMVGMK